jgi:hypothetical protein
MRCRRPSILTTVVAAAAFSLLMAGCGSNSPSSSSVSASGDHSTPAQTQQEAVRFSDCMRSHGVPNFPDPTTSPHAFKSAFNPSSAHSPGFLPAETACRHLLPPGGQDQSPAHSQAQIAALLAFARCLRTHGFPNFPDPTTGGEITREMIASAGINLDQPAAVHAADACVGVTHGVVTKAVVARFIAGQ